MKKFIIVFGVLLMALLTQPAVAWTQRPPLPLKACKAHSPFGFPDSTKTLIPICRQGYLVGYDAEAKIPQYVTYELLPQNAIGCVPRTDAFVADQSIKNGARPDDYVGTGYDKGHATPDGDQSWDTQVEYESFLMTNMYPQAGSLNRGIWKLLETSVRGWAVQYKQTFIIYVGAYYDNNDKQIGNGVIVPHGYYKIVINKTTGEVAGWAFPHTVPYPNLGNDLTVFRKPIKEIMANAKVQFEFPKNAKEVQVGKEWIVDFGALTNAKRAACK